MNLHRHAQASRRGSFGLVTAALAVALCCVSGCQEPVHPGRGVVAFTDGEPVRAGGVELRSLATGDRYAAKIGRDGSFALASQAGAPGVPPGDYEAVVVLIVVTEDLAAADHQHGRNVPHRYADYYTSGLRVSIASINDGPIEVTLDPE